MASPSTDMARWSVSWRNPYTEPPGGKRVIAAVLVRRGEKCPQELYDMVVPGSGWTIGWELVSQRPVRRWSPEAKGRTRRRNMRSRLEKRVPLFADMFEQEELASRPRYFAGEDPR